MTVVVNHYYHTRLHDEEVAEIMADTAHIPMSETLRDAIFHFMKFAQAAMLGVMNTDCIVMFTYEDNVCQCKFLLINPLTRQVLLLVQLAQGLDEALNAIEREFHHRKYKKVYRTVSPDTVSVIRTMPWASVRKSLYKYISLLSEVEKKKYAMSHGLIDVEKIRVYSHLNDVQQGCLKMVRRYPAEAGFKAFNITVQLHMPAQADAPITYEMLEEARGAVYN